MTIAPRSYLPEPKPAKFPPELAIMILKKAQAMAAKHEEDCLDAMTRTARQMLAKGMEPAEVAWQLKL